jgi:hypothetical protein
MQPQACFLSVTVKLTATIMQDQVQAIGLRSNDGVGPQPEGRFGSRTADRSLPVAGPLCGSQRSKTRLHVRFVPYFSRAEARL